MTIKKFIRCIPIERCGIEEQNELIKQGFIIGVTETTVEVFAEIVEFELPESLPTIGE